MSKHVKNQMKKTYADKKVDAKGNKLSEKIGKGIDEIQAKKATDYRKKIIGVFVDPSVKSKFIMACAVLGVKQADILNMAIDETIKKALK